MSRRPKKRPRPGRRGQKRKQGPIKATVLKHPSGFRIIRAGRNVIFDRSEMTDESHAEFRATMESYAWTLPKDVADDAALIRQLLTELPTLPTLATLAYVAYRVDPENYRESELEYVSNQVEWPTRVALSLSAPVPLDPARPVLDAERFQKLLDALRRLYPNLRELIGSEFVRRGKSRPGPLDEIVMGKRNYELHVRNLAYRHQEEDWLRRLFGPLSSDLERLVGFDIEQAISFAGQVARLVNERLMGRMAEGHSSTEAVRELLSERGVRTPEEQEAQAGWLLATWSTTFMDVPFTIDWKDLEPAERASKFLDQFSLPFGLEEPARPGPVLDLLERPLVRLGDGKYLAHIPLLVEAIRRNLEAVIRLDDGAWKKYQKHRADELETFTAKLWKKVIPAATVDQNVKFTLSDGTPGEVDVICRVDRTLILCECKAGAIKAAKRQSAMLRSLRQVLKMAHEQALKAREHIVSGSGQFLTAEGQPVRIEPDDYERIILSVVTLDDISAFTTNVAYAVGAKILAPGDIPWAVSITDFEIMADLVDLNVLLPHYLIRRARLAQWDKFTAIEELDWFMHYLSEGLYFADDLSEMPPVNLLSFTQPLDDYYMYKFGPRRKPAPKPSVRIERGFKDLLRALEEAHPAGWLEAALMLIHVGGETREQILRFLRELRMKTAAAGRGLYVDDYLIALYSEPAGLGLLRPSMKRYAKAHMVSKNYARAVVVGVNPLHPDTAPLFGYISEDEEQMPSEAEAAAYLARFESRTIDLRASQDAAKP